MIHTGSVVIYHSAPASVTAFSAGKITIATESGDSRNVREKDIDFELHPGPAKSFPLRPPDVPALDDIMELLQGEALSFSDFTSFLFGNFTPDTAYASWKLLKSGIYFRFDGGSVTPRPKEEIEAAEAAIREKTEAKERHAALLERIKKGALLPEDTPFLAEIEQVALGINSASRLLRELDIEALPEKAHGLLLKLGVWDLTRNPFPARAGVVMENPVHTLSALPDVFREDLTHIPSYAIDDEYSNDPDDAVGFQDGLLYVHVADPAAVMEFGSECDLDARSRGENLYLPEKIVHMLPADATLRFGLGLAETSPAITFAIRFSQNGAPVLERVCLSTVRVERRTYENASDLLASPDYAELLNALEKFRLLRKEAGALFIRLPEVKIVLDGDEIRFVPCPVTPEREFVANCMLAAGAAVAKWAAENDIPMPFVRQEPPDTAPDDSESLSSMFALRKGCHPGVTDTLPGLHAGLGLEPYIRVTSPLRRYADLLAHFQLHRYLSGEELLTSDELTDALHTSEDAAVTRRKLERLVNEYWTLIYFHRAPKEFTTEAVLVYRQDDRAIFLLPEFAYEYKSRFRGGQTGDHFSAHVIMSDPSRFTLRLRLEGLPDEE